MFAIDRQNLGPALGGQPHHLRPGHHQRLFVRQGDGLAGVERGPSARQASTSDDGRQRRCPLPAAARSAPVRAGPTSSSVSAGKADQSKPRAAASSVATTNRGRNSPGLLAQLGQPPMGRQGDDFAAARADAATTSSVLRPMLPVEPRRAILRGRWSIAGGRAA